MDIKPIFLFFFFKGAGRPWIYLLWVSPSNLVTNCSLLSRKKKKRTGCKCEIHFRVTALGSFMCLENKNKNYRSYQITLTVWSSQPLEPHKLAPCFWINAGYFIQSDCFRCRWDTILFFFSLSLLCLLDSSFRYFFFFNSVLKREHTSGGENHIKVIIAINVSSDVQGMKAHLWSNSHSAMLNILCERRPLRLKLHSGQ